ncbi:DNA phosphorothioation-dependent restriction protein DptG [Enterococcus nangangensis]|uniref:DNA phosphorothioation-dependent restriction protein DptG n=1 Tax=Enterococcus nangangensis TaxID=2559926 RepID=UPI0010F60AB6|nr:DNA phosphorothioation-dependent restriction protein DptG [Enterococcus nangangensis]
MSRESVSNGYKLFKDSSIDLLVNNDLLDYLNILSEKNKYQTLEEIMQDVDNYGILGRNLMEFNSLLANKLGEGYDSVLDIKKQILQLKKFIEILNPEEAKSRYRKSFDEFSGLNLIKSRGRLGYVFNLTQEFILLFVEIIIGNRSKILLNELFAEFGKRGIFFDKQTKKSIIQFFEEINILEKLSDSGDAQYVKSIL